MPTLKVRLVGPKVRPGKISVEDLKALAAAIEDSIQRLADRKLRDAPSLRRGPRTNAVKSLVNLYVTGIEGGSTVVEFEPGPGQEDIYGNRLGSGIFEEWIDGAHSLQDPTGTLPAAFDRGVLTGIHLLHPILTRGVDRIEIEWDDNHRKAKAVFDAGTATRTESLLMRPAQNRRSISGIVLQADLHAPDVTFTVYTVDGGPVKCTAGEEDMSTVLAGLMHMVRVSGEAAVDPSRGTITSLRADSIELGGPADLPGLPFVDVSDFWLSPDLAAIESRQGILPFSAQEAPGWEPPTQEEADRYEEILRKRRQPSASVL